jgi:hypothetical protein
MKNKKRKSTEEKIDIITEGLELGWVETARRQNISYPTLQNWRSLNEALGCGVASVEALLDGLTKADCNNACPWQVDVKRSPPPLHRRQTGICLPHLATASRQYHTTCGL